MMSPFDYAQLYWNLPVPIINEAGEITKWELFRVNKYRLADRLPDEEEAYDADTTAYLNEFERNFNPFPDKDVNEITLYTKNADGNINTQIYTRAEKKKLLGIAKRAIWGKGTPEQCQITLQLAYRFGIADSVEKLQKYCADGKVGLDCNGFVGTYMRDVLGKNVDHNTPINVLIANGRPVNSFDEMNNQHLYIFGMVSGSGEVIGRVVNGKHGHIMITTFSPFADTVGVIFNGTNHTNPSKTYKRVKVVESTGGAGFVESDYLLIEEEKKNGVNTGVFKVHRGSKNSFIRVRISRVYI